MKFVIGMQGYTVNPTLRPGYTCTITRHMQTYSVSIRCIPSTPLLESRYFVTFWYFSIGLETPMHILVHTVMALPAIKITYHVSQWQVDTT